MGLSRWGALWTNEGGEVALNLTTTPVLLNRWEHTADGPGVDADSDTHEGIVIKVPGTYLAIANISFIGATGDTYYAQLRINGEVGSDIHSSVDGVTGGTSFMAVMAAATLAIGDVVTVYVYSDNVAGATFTLTNGQFGLVSI